jgi:CHAT domain-containing protein
VGGDPTGDLPATRAECRHVARQFGTTAASGAEVTVQWLADRLSAGARLVHLSCHGSFHELRPERSGLLLVGPDGQPDLVDLGRLSALAWSGAAVVLSACHTGRHHVRYGDELAGLGHTLLAAGAAAVVASLRPVPDLSTALMMTWLYDSLDVDAHWTPRYLASALEGAQRRMSESSARDLVEWADGHRRWGPEETLLACQVVAAALRAAGNVEEHVDWQEHVVRLRRENIDPDDDAWARIRATVAANAYAVRPFRQPAHWATFVVFGAV